MLNSWLIWKPTLTLLKPLIALLGLFSLWLVAVILLSKFKVLMPMAIPSIAILSVSSLVAFAAWKRDREGKKFIERAFSQYVNPTVVKAIVDQPDDFKLGGERRFITSVSTDLADFTQFCEKLEPEQVAAIMNQYLGKVCELFTEHEATIDKIVGDAVVGFFGAPISQTQQADRAIGLALAIDRFSQGFREEMAGADRNFGSTRIGVHSGLAIVGNFGGKRFFDYTAVGDTVNTASRLEGANKRLGTRICISTTVADGATNTGNLRPSGSIQLAGKTELIQVFEALKTEDVRPDVMKLYVEAYETMRSGDAKAKELFEKLGKLAPGDQLIVYHCRRLQAGAIDDKVSLEEK
jgi:adenylate cyclase